MRNKVAKYQKKSITRSLPISRGQVDRGTAPLHVAVAADDARLQMGPLAAQPRSKAQWQAALDPYGRRMQLPAM